MREKQEFQSTRPLRGATDVAHRLGHPRRISIHAPLAGRDCQQQSLAHAQTQISIHAPLAGRDRLQETIFDLKMEFQSTRPLRGATIQ